ncbi:MAG TPA: S-layer homology domain-containing protein, partial [Allocoleopsis sp.]
TTTVFPDTQNHWAQPFIKPLAARGIVTGYLDGTYRPENPIARDEFAAVIRKAFNQPAQRQIASGSVFKDVPDNYWAEPAIEEAYETGFMAGYPEGLFYPRNSVSRVEALAVLAKNLNLSGNTATPATVQPAPEATPEAEAAPAQPQRRQALRRPLLFPLAMTSMMQPFVNLPVRHQAAGSAASTGSQDPANKPIAEAKSPALATAPNASTTVRNYYVDANEIPAYQVDAVAEATKAGVVVNHPDPQLLRPNYPATRGEIAAFVYQAMVDQGRVEPLASDAPATTYIVKDPE